MPTSANPPIILASGSPRRTEILTMAGICHEIIVSGADETVDGPPDQQVKDLSLRKARAVFDTLPTPKRGHIIIAADTLVSIQGQILGKPAHEEEAYAMLSALSGHTHQVYTGVTVFQNNSTHTFCETTHVTFRPIGEGEIMAYITTGQPFDKAGAYGIQDKAAIFIQQIEGDYYNVMGLPLSKLCLSLASFGYNCWG